MDEETTEPKLLCDLYAVAAEPAAAAVRWKHTESGRQLDANVVRLGADAEVGLHRETELDVLLLVVGGEGTLRFGSRHIELRPGLLVDLPHGSSRSLHAGAEGLSYLTVHRRRPGMQIGRRPA
jgi:quercetin dioxygenase-like cupin family protein